MQFSFPLKDTELFSLPVGACEKHRLRLTCTFKDVNKLKTFFKNLFFNDVVSMTGMNTV